LICHRTSGEMEHDPPNHLSPRSLETLKSYFKENQMDFEPVTKQINSIIVKSIMSVQTTNVSGGRMYRTGERRKCVNIYYIS
jgi:hypothetical protein